MHPAVVDILGTLRSEQYMEALMYPPLRHVNYAGMSWARPVLGASSSMLRLFKMLENLDCRTAQHELSVDYEHC